MPSRPPSPPRRPRGAQGLPVAEAAPALIRKAQKRVLRLGRSIGPDSPATELHRLRSSSSVCGTPASFFRRPSRTPPAARIPFADYLRAMVRFQDCLGGPGCRGRHRPHPGPRQGHGPDRSARARAAAGPGEPHPGAAKIAHERRGGLAKLWARFDWHSVRRQLTALAGEAPSAPGIGGTPQTSPA